MAKRLPTQLSFHELEASFQRAYSNQLEMDFVRDLPKNSEKPGRSGERTRPIRRKNHGGSLSQGGKRKTARPIIENQPLHLVLRSSRAKGASSMLRARYEKLIERLVRHEARRAKIRLYRFVNVGNHLHLVVLPVKREFLSRFLRVVSGKIARLILAAEKGRKALKTLANGTRERFWDAIPFSRILEWGRDFRGALGYLKKNALEALGWVFEPSRKTRFVLCEPLGPDIR